MSESFETPQPGFPGSPSHVVARNLTTDSAVVCWRESAVGRPFTTYSVEITESLAIERSKVLRVNMSSVGPILNCSTGIQVNSRPVTQLCFFIVRPFTHPNLR